MHLTFGVTGIYKDVREFCKWWETRTMWVPFTEKDGRTGKMPIESQLRPIQFYELIFPKEELYKVINTLKPNPTLKSANALNIPDLPLTAIRKALNLKKIPAPDLSAGQYDFPEHFNIRVVGVGIREDKNITDENGRTFEGL